MMRNDVQLASHKTEALVLTGRRTNRNATITVNDTQVQTSNSLKYLGIRTKKGVS